jgi:Hemerythrin HHE cation binding domain
MAEIIELIAADHLHIMRWQMRLAELHHRRGEPGDTPALAITWNTLASLIDLHMAADEEVCGPAIYGTRPRGRDLAREARDAHEDIREIIRETSQYPPGSALWWALVPGALTAWTRYLHREVYGPLAGCRRRPRPPSASSCRPRGQSQPRYPCCPGQRGSRGPRDQGDQADAVISRAAACVDVLVSCGFQ